MNLPIGLVVATGRGEAVLSSQEEAGSELAPLPIAHTTEKNNKKVGLVNILFCYKPTLQSLYRSEKQQ